MENLSQVIYNYCNLFTDLVTRTKSGDSTSINYWGLGWRVLQSDTFWDSSYSDPRFGMNVDFWTWPLQFVKVEVKRVTQGVYKKPSKFFRIIVLPNTFDSYSSLLMFWGHSNSSCLSRTDRRQKGITTMNVPSSPFILIVFHRSWCFVGVKRTFCTFFYSSYRSFNVCNYSYLLTYMSSVGLFVEITTPYSHCEVMNWNLQTKVVLKLTTVPPTRWF